MDVEGPPGVGDGVRYASNVGPGVSGVRVVVRHRLPDGGLTDVLGELRSWAAGELLVERRDGTVARICAADVVAAKRIPPAPRRRP